MAVTLAGPRRDAMVVVRSRRLGLSTRVHFRAVVAPAVVGALAFVAFCLSLMFGEIDVPLDEVLGALFTTGSPESFFVIRTLRLPRALTGILVGAAFGLSGAIFQRLARNPLASPDIIGISAGAAAAAVLVIVVSHGTSTQITLGALVGATLTALAVYLLAYKRGITGYRLVLVGIGVTAMLGAVVEYLLTRAEIFEAQAATIWLTGSLNGRGWDHVRPVGLALAVLVPLTLGLARQLRALELGDDAARGLGARVETVRALLLLAGAALAAVATASAGPVAFVALVSPQIARLLVGGRTLAFVPSMAVGALLLTTSDLVARLAFSPTELPVGVVTAMIGAPYLLLLLARANKIGATG